MGVDSYLEIFTTLIGWHLAGVLWDVLVTTKLIAIPFFYIIAEHWSDAFVNNGDGSSQTGQRALERDFFCALIVIAVGCMPSPATQLQRSEIAYQPRSTSIDPTPAMATGATSNSTYGSALSVTNASVPVPVFFYAVMGFSSGINQAFMAGTNFNVDGVRAVMEAASRTTVEDPRLRAEVTRFGNECFTRARTAMQGQAPLSPEVTAAINEFGATDTEWLGSRAFLNDPSLYSAFRARSAVEGWALDATRDADVAGNNPPPPWGQPTCAQWWSDPTLGLKSRIVESARTQTRFAEFLNNVASTIPADIREDTVARIALNNAQLLVMNNAVNRTNDSTGTQWLAGTVGSWAALWGHFFTFVMMSIVKPSLPLAQAMLLMATYAFSPLILTLARFQITAMLQIAVIIFTLKFFTSVWYVVESIDDKLVPAMYPGRNEFLATLGSMTGFGSMETTKALMLNLVVASMYLLLPGVLGTLMAIAGFKLAGSIGAAINDGTKNAGQGGSMAYNTMDKKAHQFGSWSMGKFRALNNLGGGGKKP